MATETSSRRPHEVIAGRALVNLLSSIAQGIETPTSRLTDTVVGKGNAKSLISMNQGKKKRGKYSKKKKNALEKNTKIAESNIVPSYIRNNKDKPVYDNSVSKKRKKNPPETTDTSHTSVKQQKILKMVKRGGFDKASAIHVSISRIIHMDLLNRAVNRNNILMHTIQQNQFNIFQQQQMMPNFNHGAANLARMGMHSNTAAYGKINNQISGHHQLHGRQIINQIPRQLDGQMASQANGHRMGSHQPLVYMNGNSNLMPSSVTLANDNKSNFSGVYGNAQVPSQAYTAAPRRHIQQQLPQSLTPQQLQQMYMMQQQKKQQIISASHYNLLHPNSYNSKILSEKKQVQQQSDAKASIGIPYGVAYNDLVNQSSQQIHNVNGQQKNNLSSTILNQQYLRQLQQQPTQITTAEQLLLERPSLMQQSLPQTSVTDNSTSYMPFDKPSNPNNKKTGLGMEASTSTAVGSSTAAKKV
jgi:hypothetical protein